MAFLTLLLFRLSVRLFLCPVTEFSVCPVRGGMPPAHAEGQRVQVRLGGGRWSQLVGNDSLPFTGKQGICILKFAGSILFLHFWPKGEATVVKIA